MSDSNIENLRKLIDYESNKSLFLRFGLLNSYKGEVCKNCGHKQGSEYYGCEHYYCEHYDKKVSKILKERNEDLLNSTLLFNKIRVIKNDC